MAKTINTRNTKSWTTPIDPSSKRTHTISHTTTFPSISQTLVSPPRTDPKTLSSKTSFTRT